MLRLRMVGSRQVLHHTGTGETVPLDGQWVLLRDEQGNGILSPNCVGGSPSPAVRPKWAPSMLRRRLAEIDSGERKGLAIFEGQAMLGWQDELKRGDRSSMTFAARRMGADKVFMSECVLCRFPPRGSSSTVWWNPAHVLQLLLGNPKYNSWVSRTAMLGHWLGQQLCSSAKGSLI